MLRHIASAPAFACTLIAAFSAPALASAQTAPAGKATSLVSPQLVGNTVQAGVGDIRVGATNGLIGKQGTPTTRVAVSVLTPTNPPQGSVATVGVLSTPGQPLIVRAPSH